MAPSSRRSRPWIVAGSIVAVLAVAGIAFIVFSGGGGEAAEDTDEAPSAETPRFSFKIDEASAVSTVDAETKTLKGPTKTAAKQASDLLQALYTAGYLDPANWQEGTYDTVLQAFDPGAREAAASDLESLTAGADAGATFTSIQPGRSKLSVKVLFGDESDPEAIEVNATFSAKGVTEGGSATNILSQGSYFLQPSGADWKITAFEVDRREKAGKSTGTNATPTEASS
ncbi:MAG: hypothetical protein WEA54_03880 [Actinomycetota bacterium]